MHNTLRKIRIDNGITQKEMAEILGVSRSCIANWESGIRKADIKIACPDRFDDICFKGTVR